MNPSSFSLVSLNLSLYLCYLFALYLFNSLLLALNSKNANPSCTWGDIIIPPYPSW
jgi:hypothetical protein